MATPWTVARQAPLSMGFSRQEYWSGLPFSSDLDEHDSFRDPYEWIMARSPFCVWLISLSITSSRVIHVAAGVRPRRPSFLRLKTSHCVTLATFRLFIHQWTPGLLAAFSYRGQCCYGHGLHGAFIFGPRVTFKSWLSGECLNDPVKGSGGSLGYRCRGSPKCQP